jgi:hypothetical protein
MRFKRSKKPVTPVTELNDLLAADAADRSEFIGELSEPVAKALLLYLVNRWHNR